MLACGPTGGDARRSINSRQFQMSDDLTEAFLSKRAIILEWMMARSEAWLSVTSSAAVCSYRYSYYDCGNESAVPGKSRRVEVRTLA